MLKIVKKPAPAPAEAAPKATTKGKADVAGKTESSSVNAIAGAELVPMFAVRVAMGYSHKLANENWVKCEVEITIPARAEDVDEAYTYAKDFTDSKINERVEEFTKAEAE